MWLYKGKLPDKIATRVSPDATDVTVYDAVPDYDCCVAAQVRSAPVPNLTAIHS